MALTGLDYTQNVEYQLKCSEHAKCGLALRYGIEITKDEIIVTYLRRNGDIRDDGSFRCNLSIHGLKVLAVINKNVLVTALPNSPSMKTEMAVKLHTCFDILCAAVPGLFSYGDIIKWRAGFLASSKSDSKRYDKDDLRRETAKRRRILEANQEAVAFIDSRDSDPPDLTYGESAAVGWATLQTSEQALYKSKLEIEEQAAFIAKLENQARLAPVPNDRPKAANDLCVQGPFSEFGLEGHNNEAPKKLVIDCTSVFEGTPNNGIFMGENHRNIPINKHNDCNVCHISMAEEGNAWHKIFVEHFGQYFVITTRIKRVAESYRVGDNVIFTASYGPNKFLDQNAMAS